MGMAKTDDEQEIFKEYLLMEKIREIHPGYELMTHNMSEDQKTIYDHSLKEKFKELFNKGI